MATEVKIEAGSRRLAGYLTVPEGAPGIVLFAHGSGSSRDSPRNQFVADLLNEAGLGTLLFDLLSEREESDRANVFDIALLADRLVDATRWLVSRPGFLDTRIGYLGSSTGAAAALRAAADAGAAIAAVVSRGGRPDLAGSKLAVVTAPTLLIVGGRDQVVLDLNGEAQAHLGCVNRLEVVPGATHLFEEPGTLRKAAELARDWFLLHLASDPDLSHKDQPDPRLSGPDRQEWPDEDSGLDEERTLLAAQEEAQGIEVFTNPDAVVSSSRVVEGAPGHETLAGSQVGLGRDAEEEDRGRNDEEFHEA